MCNKSFNTSTKNSSRTLAEQDLYCYPIRQKFGAGSHGTRPRLIPGEFANETTYVIARKLTKWHCHHNKSIAREEFIFLRQCKNKATGKCDRFYLTIKMHKKPWKTRPVVSTCGAYLHALSRWVDFHLQKLTSFVPTYLQDSHQLLEELKQLGTLPITARLFTADTVSMYTNIGSTHALQVLHNILQDNKNQLPMNFPGDSLMDALQIVMDNYVFKFGNEHFKQCMGTAM
ncbi:hypothetical protein ACHAXS_000039, partial [Conticribra weissflogii]